MTHYCAKVQRLIRFGPILQWNFAVYDRIALISTTRTITGENWLGKVQTIVKLANLETKCLSRYKTLEKLKA